MRNHRSNVKGILRVAKSKHGLILTTLAVGILFVLGAAAVYFWQQHETEAREAKVRETLRQSAETVRFMENKGQLADSNILYYFDSKHGAAYIERDKIRFVAYDTEERDIQGPRDQSSSPKTKKERLIKSTHAFSLNLDGANPAPKIKLGQAFGTRYNYFLGTDPSKWQTGVQAAKDLTLQGVYPGVDLRLYSNDEGSMEFDWIMAPGADFSKVKMHFSGQDGLTVTDDGSLKVGLRFTDVRFRLPESYQVTNNGKENVDFAFNKTDENTVGFTTSTNIDDRYPLVIDPTLNWGTFIDGNQSDFDAYLLAVQVDPVDGMSYCAGYTSVNIPTNAAPYDANGFRNFIPGLGGFPSGLNAQPSAAIIYRINSTGTDLVDLTLYGPNGFSAADQDVRAYSLSLSPTKVFVGGFTDVDIPLAGGPFDAARNGTDGFVAVFSRDLGTLNYATYLGSSGNEGGETANDNPTLGRGVTSIRALSDTSFVVGLSPAAALPANYISVGAAQTGFGGGTSDMYLARFTNLNTLSWGTYVGGAANEIFNDLEVFPDGRVAFTGFVSGAGAFHAEVNSAAAASAGVDEDGVIGVVNNTGTTFNYLDKIGGPGNDRINDVELAGSTMFWTGSASAGFPSSAGAYDTSQNGGTDAVIGSVSDAGGAGSYKATFYGTQGDDISAMD